jgi:hypothetical protein
MMRRNLVDNRVVDAAWRPVLFVLPEGAAEPETEPLVFTSVETEPGRKFLRAFCCLRAVEGVHVGADIALDVGLACRAPAA